MKIIVRQKDALRGKVFDNIMLAQSYLASKSTPHELVVNGAIVIKNY